MKLKPIETAPISTEKEQYHILLYWKNSNHYEDGWIYKNDDNELYHVLFDGERLKDNPTDWCKLPSYKVLFDGKPI